jgi:NTE family protein
MLFHVGVLWRLYQLGILQKVARISSVSGGSITSAYLGLQWNALGLNSAAPADDVKFQNLFVKGIRGLAGHTVDVWSVVVGLVTPSTIAESVASSYDKYLFNGKTLQDLPDSPRFVINATNVQTGSLFRFSKPFIADWRVGQIPKSQLRLALAVASSSAFPPVLSPMELKFDPAQFQDLPHATNQTPEFRSKVVLSDGGVYDNLGLETVWKRYDTVLVSDAGQNMEADPDPAENWAGHSLRVLNLIDNQVRDLRKRQVNQSLALYQHFHSQGGVPAELLPLVARKGAFFSIRDDLEIEHQAPKKLACPFTDTTQLASVSTRLSSLDDATQDKLINWGYAVCDASIRAHYDQTLPPPKAFPYPASGV